MYHSQNWETVSSANGMAASFDGGNARYRTVVEVSASFTRHADGISELKGNDSPGFERSIRTLVQ